MKLFYYDLETTGTKFWQNGIHQISGCIEIDGKVTEYFDFKVQPYEKAIIETPALLVSKISEEDLKTYQPMKSCYRDFIVMLCKYVDRYNPKDKFFMVGYNNAAFDNDFLRMWFKHNGSEFFGAFFWANTIDVMVLASQVLMEERHKMVNFKQSTVAQHFGLKVDENRLHDGKYDAEILRQIYYSIKNRDIL